MAESNLGTLLFLLSWGCDVYGARILAVLPLYAASHHKYFQPTLASLARAGHHVTVYSPFPMNNPPDNYTDVTLENVVTESEEISRFILEMTEYPYWKCLDHYPHYVKVFYKEFIENNKVQKLLKSNEKFDLVITQSFTMQEYTLILGHIFKVPVIVLQSAVTNNIINYFMGNSLSFTFMPDICAGFPNKMTFLQRFLNSVYSLRTLFYIYYHKHLTVVDNIMKPDFPDMPPLLDMITNVSLVFVNDHMTVDYAQPRSPNIIPIGGIHIPEKKPLPQDLKKIMDEATEGVIIFSLGTYIPDHYKPKKYFDMFIKVFGKLRQKVLWKTKKDNIEGLPENVMAVKWLPQRDVLDHPNLVLFITHGGLLSQLETVNAAVPVIAIPQFFDQHRNAKFYEEMGIGTVLGNEELSEDTILVTIQRILNNPMYQENVQRLSRVFQDRPQSPAETVVFWTEYVLRHGGAHLKPASTQLALYQRALLDLAALVVTLVLLVVYILKKIAGVLLCRRQCEQDVKKKSN